MLDMSLEKSKEFQMSDTPDVAARSKCTSQPWMSEDNNSGNPSACGGPRAKSAEEYLGRKPAGTAACTCTYVCAYMRVNGAESAGRKGSKNAFGY
jgi:hypothetical protein